MTTRNFELRIIIFFLTVLLLLLGSYTQSKSDQNKALKTSIQKLQLDIDHQRENNQQRVDSLQHTILLQENLQKSLQDSLHLLRHQRKHLNQKSDDNKTAILRMRAVDSLYHLVAGKYRAP